MKRKPKLTKRHKAIVDRIGVANATQLHNSMIFLPIADRWPSGRRKPAKKVVRKIG